MEAAWETIEDNYISIYLYVHLNKIKFNIATKMKSDADHLLDITEGYVYSRNCQKYYRFILPSLIDFSPKRYLCCFQMQIFTHVMTSL